MIILIAAVARNGIIGANNELPWRLPADMKRFRALTMGHPMVMGRLTFESIGRALPGRTTVVLTSRQGFRAEGVTVAHSVDSAIDAARDAHGMNTDIYVAGGEQVYAAFLPLAQRMELTLVDATPDGDAVFPAWDHAAWRPVAAEHVVGNPSLDFVTLERAPLAASVG